MNIKIAGCEQIFKIEGSNLKIYEDDHELYLEVDFVDNKFKFKNHGSFITNFWGGNEILSVLGAINLVFKKEHLIVNDLQQKDNYWFSQDTNRYYPIKLFQKNQYTLEYSVKIVGQEYLFDIIPHKPLARCNFDYENLTISSLNELTDINQIYTVIFKDAQQYLSWEKENVSSLSSDKDYQVDILLT